MKIDKNQFDEFNEIPGLSGKFMKDDPEVHSTEERVELQLKREGYKYLTENKAVLKPIVMPLIEAAAIFERFLDSLETLTQDHANIMTVVHLANRKAIKEAIPDLPDHALDILCAGCLDTLLKIYQSNAEVVNKVLDLYGIEVSQASWGRKNLPKEQ